MKTFMLALLTMKRLLIVYTVWQSGMTYKPQKEGTKGKFLKVIKSMYPSILLGAV